MDNQEDLPPVDEMPVLPAAIENMRLDLAVSDLGEVYIFHEKEMPERVNWVEYDRDVYRLYFISEKGRIQGIGMTVKKPLDEVISEAKRIFLIHRVEGETLSAFEMPLVHQLKKL